MDPRIRYVKGKETQPSLVKFRDKPFNYNTEVCTAFAEYFAFVHMKSNREDVLDIIMECDHER